MTSIKNLNLSPMTYIILSYNGIKTVEGLSKYSKEELLQLEIPRGILPSREKQKEIVEEIDLKLIQNDTELESKDDEETLDTEKRVRELNLSSVTIERLKRNRIVTAGVLSTYEEKDFNLMYRIGKKTLSDIKSVLPLEKGKIKIVPRKEMIFKDLSEEDIEYHNKQEAILIKQIEEESRKEKELKKQQEENKRRKDILMSMKISDLYIPEPVLSFKVISLNPIEDMSLGQLVHYNFRKQDFINKLELENAISRLNIKGLHLELLPKEYNELEISELDLRRIEEYKLERRIEALKLIERVYKEELKNKEIKEEIRKNKNLVEYLESLEQENARLTAINNKYKSIIDEYGIDPSESGQGQHRK